MPIPPKGSIPRRTRRRETSDAGLGNLLGGLGGLFEGLFKGLGKTIESVQNLSLEDLEKLAEAQGNEEAKERIAELKKRLGEKEIGDLFREGFDLNKLIDLATKHGGIVQHGVRGHILGKPFGGNLPLERRGAQETQFDVKGTRPKRAPQTKKEPSPTQDIRKMELDLIDETETHLKYCGEMPGLEEADIVCEVKEKGNILSVCGKEIKLPKPVIKKVSWSYKNGVLEIILIKKKS